MSENQSGPRVDIAPRRLSLLTSQELQRRRRRTRTWIIAIELSWSDFTWSGQPLFCKYYCWRAGTSTEGLVHRGTAVPAEAQLNLWAPCSVVLTFFTLLLIISPSLFSHISLALMEPRTRRTNQHRSTWSKSLWAARHLQRRFSRRGESIMDGVFFEASCAGFWDITTATL